MNVNVIAAAAVVSLAGFVPFQAQAQFGGIKVPSVPGLSKGDASQNFDLRGGQAGFYNAFEASQSKILEAQVLLAKAFEMNDLAEALETEAQFIGAGDLDSDGVKNSMQVTKNANSALNAKLEEGAELSAEGREFYMRSLPILLEGTLLASKLPDEAKSLSELVQNAAANGSMGQKVEAARLVVPMGSVAQAMPGFVQSTFASYKAVVSYGNQKGLPVPENATDALGDL